MTLNVIPETADATQEEKIVNEIIKDINTLTNEDKTDNKLDISNIVTPEFKQQLLKNNALVTTLENALGNLHDHISNSGISKEDELKNEYWENIVDALWILYDFIQAIKNEYAKGQEIDNYSIWITPLTKINKPNGKVWNIDKNQANAYIATIDSVLENAWNRRTTLLAIKNLLQDKQGDVNGIQTMLRESPSIVTKLSEKTWKTTDEVKRRLNDNNVGSTTIAGIGEALWEITWDIQTKNDIEDYLTRDPDQEIFTRAKQLKEKNQESTPETENVKDYFPEEISELVKDDFNHFNTINTEWNSLNIWNSNTRNLIGWLINAQLQPKDKENAQKTFDDIKEIKDKINDLWNTPENKTKEQAYGKKIANLKADLWKQLEKGFINNIKNTIIDTYKDKRTDYKKITDIENNEKLTSDMKQAQFDTFFKGSDNVQKIKDWYTELENKWIKIVGTIDEPKVKLKGQLKKYFKDDDDEA